MSDSSPASTQAPVTPQSTGSLDVDFSPSGKDKPDPFPWNNKQRRQVAFYPNMNASNKPQKPFSRSAAKRESVMTLGSIEHLQHYFTKTGLAANKDSLSTATKGLVPALGHGVTQLSMLSGDEVPHLKLPPSPVIPQPTQPAFPPYVKTFEVDPENLRPGLIDDLESVIQIWRLNDDSGIAPSSPQDQDPTVSRMDGDRRPSDHFDVLKALKITTHAIRSVRNYVVSLPSESSTISGNQRQHYRPQHLTNLALQKRHIPNPSSASIALSRTRKAALSTLSVLRLLEESSRLPLLDDAYDAQSDHGSQGRVASPSNHSDSGDGDRSTASDENQPAFTLIRVQGRNEQVPVWEDLDDDFNQPQQEQKREGWEERLVLGSGWLYRQDILLSSLAKEKEEVGTYLDVVDEVLFGGPKNGQRGWRRERDRSFKNRRVSAGEADRRGAALPDIRPFNRRVVSTSILNDSLAEEPEEMDSIEEESAVDDDDLPHWAKRGTFQDDPLGRMHALFKSVLPSPLAAVLPDDASDRTTLLEKLASGQLLCVAYNAAVRQSRKPWGFISQDSIHDIVTLEASAEACEAKRSGWTFRRSDNLRLWAAALKLRYLLPVIMPTSEPNLKRGRALNGVGFASPDRGSNTPSHGTPVASPTRQTPKPEERPVFFDGPLVAKQGEGWDTMLETAIDKWVECVVAEQRGEW
ncbi:hypothetical protein BJ322DRAFT_1002048 [Thelephora terrestris]|uniref:Uncharacterized protein n=1 Tax=Thelephora terrestris TaxID=56493 RepID=A0A9P6HKE3_9AGAM|nr:hypothetical protein BJ322DRAFT_1002048 [Thelephora terrestris]